MTYEDLDPFDTGPPHRSCPGQRKGMPPPEYWAWNVTRQCAVPGCKRMREPVGRYCRNHYRRFVTYGHISKRHLPGSEIWKTKIRARALLDASIEAQHPTALAGVEAIRRLLAPGSFIHAEEKHEYLRRISSTANPREVIAETVAVCACLVRFDPDGYHDPDYLATQIARRLLKLGPRRYTGGGELKSLKRSKAMAGAVLDVCGPLVTLMVATVERNRKLRRRKRTTTNPKGTP